MNIAVDMDVTVVEDEVVVWFACKSCSPTPSFPNLRAFIAHKKCSHYEEFKNTKCIVLEERTTISTQNFGQDGCLDGQHLCDLVTIEIKTEPESILSDLPAPAPVPAPVPSSHEENDDHFEETENSQLTFSPKTSTSRSQSPTNELLQKINFTIENLDLLDSSWEDPLPYKATSIKTGNNPYVLIQRLTPKEIPKAYCSLSRPQPRPRPRSRRKRRNSSYSAPPKIGKRDAKPFQTLSPQFQEQLLRDSNCECKLCYRKYDTDEELKVHLESCWFDKKGNHCRRYCVPCQKMFPYPSKLQEHLLRFHAAEAEKTEAKKFACCLCPMKFIRSRELKLHEEQKHGNKEERERPFLCSECGHRFFKKFQLTQHYSRHSDVRPFKCTVENCGKAFLYIGNLKEHVACVHNQGVTERFKCTVADCKKTFKYKNDRTKHLKKKHPDTDKTQNKAESLIEGEIFQNLAQNNDQQKESSLLLLRCPLITAKHETAL